MKVWFVVIALLLCACTNSDETVGLVDAHSEQIAALEERLTELQALEERVAAFEEQIASGALQGPQGEPGPRGKQGLKGNDGARGPQGASASLKARLEECISSFADSIESFIKSSRATHGYWDETDSAYAGPYERHSHGLYEDWYGGKVSHNFSVPTYGLETPWDCTKSSL